MSGFWILKWNRYLNFNMSAFCILEWKSLLLKLHFQIGCQKIDQQKIIHMIYLKWSLYLFEKLICDYIWNS